MSLLKSRHYNFEVRNLLINTSALALTFLCLRLAIGDALTLGYALTIPVFIYISMTIEAARIEKGGFGDLRSWLETLIAVAIAAAVAYLGYKLWLMGY